MRLTMGLALMLFLGAAACSTDDDVDPSIYAIDTDGNGTVDCADQDHVEACYMYHPVEDCETSDVNHDGHIDDADSSDIHDGLTATGHECADPIHHEATH